MFHHRCQGHQAIDQISVAHEIYSILQAIAQVSAQEIKLRDVHASYKINDWALTPSCISDNPKQRAFGTATMFPKDEMDLTRGFPKAASA